MSTPPDLDSYASKVGGVEKLAELAGYSIRTLKGVKRGEVELSDKMRRAFDRAVMLAEDSARVNEDAPSTHVTGDLRLQRIPIISLAQAGDPVVWEDVYEWEDTEAFAVTDPKAVAVRIRGDSMAPAYKEGTVAILYPSTPPRSENLVIAKLKNGSVVFKRLHITGDHIHLISENESYPPIIVTPDQIERMVTVGKTERDEL